MREFFRGWRRKTGCVLLVVALVFMGGWLRSRHTADVVIFPLRVHRTASSVSIAFDCLTSSRDSLIWTRMREDDAQVAEEDMDMGSPYPVWQSSATLPNFDDPQMTWQWRWCGFGSCDYKDKDTSKHSFLFIPYWSITIPLALLSAYLILCKSPNRADN